MCSPIDVNATLHCVVNGSELEWEIDGSNFQPFERHQLHSRKIFEGPTSTLGGITMSNMIILGDIVRNMMVYYDLLSEIGACTVLIIYGKDHLQWNHFHQVSYIT